MHFDLEEQLDRRLSPADGIQALGDVYVGLPRVHRPRPLLRFVRQCLPLYHARLEWIGWGVSYVQCGEELHVLQVWDESEHPPFARRAIVIPECPDAVVTCNSNLDEKPAKEATHATF